MSPLLRLPDERDSCASCRRQVGRDKLSKCKACKIIRYCSKQCQRDHWTLHKYACELTRNGRNLLAPFPDLQRKSDALTKWTWFWKRTVIDLARVAYGFRDGLSDRLHTRVVLIEVIERPNAPSHEQAFQCVTAATMAEEQWKAWMRNKAFLDMDIDASLKRTFDDPVMRIFLVWHAIGAVRRFFQSIDHSQDLQSQFLANWFNITEETWSGVLIERIDAGKPYVALGDGGNETRVVLATN